VDYSSNTYTDTGSYSPGISTNIYSNGDGSFNGSYSAYYSGDWFTYDAVSFSNIEQFQITGTVAGDNITTGDGDDTVNGGDGNDIISAGDGDDIINGSDGDDTITGGGGINTIDGGNGIDTVVDANLSSATDALTIDDSDTGKNFTLPDGTSIANVERFTNLTLGSGNDVVNFTHQLNNMIHTGAGNDTINSGLGRDTVISGRGDDHIVVNTASLVIIELPNEGNDTIFSSINYNLAGLTQIDNLTLTGTLDINGIGNRKDNIITGNSGQNVLTGLQGNDTFVFNLGDSVVGKPDRIGDFQFGKDKIRVNGVLPSVLTHAGNSGASTLSSLVDSVFIDANRALDGNQGLGTNSAALVVSTAQGIGGTYLIVNDGLVGFNTATDLVINLMGYSDGLPGLGNIAVGSLFV
jgi:Ca2+-binding RTX toxin-like protein